MLVQILIGTEDTVRKIIWVNCDSGYDTNMKVSAICDSAYNPYMNNSVLSRYSISSGRMLTTIYLPYLYFVLSQIIRNAGKKPLPTRTLERLSEY